MPDYMVVLIIALVVLVGGAQLPKLARNVGKAQSEFKKGLKEASEEADEESEQADKA